MDRNFILAYFLHFNYHLKKKHIHIQLYVVLIKVKMYLGIKDIEYTLIQT